MEQQVIHLIPLMAIRPAPWNPPGRLDPGKVKSLAASIRQEGQRSPALIRPVESEGEVKYEIVFGHRRYAAKLLLSENDSSQAFLRAEIESMDEKHAMFVAGVENLQRQDFDEIEEAEFIRTCATQYGDYAIKRVAERLSLSPGFVRKRIAVLELPEVFLDLWRRGIWNLSHLGQLLRLDKEGLETFAENVQQDDYHLKWTVRDLQAYIDRQSISLSFGFFDKTECRFCVSSTDFQRKLFDLDRLQGRCLNTKCFQVKQQAWLDAHWQGSKQNKHNTNIAVIGDHETHCTGDFGWQVRPDEKCQSCPQFGTVMHLFRGSPVREQVCLLGETSCFAAHKKKEDRTPKENKSVNPEAPRSTWHGEFFRQEFYRQEIPKLMEKLPIDNPRRLQISLAIMVWAHRPAMDWFAGLNGIAFEKESSRYFFPLHFHHVLEWTKGLSSSRLELLLGEAVLLVTLQKEDFRAFFSDEDRQALAQFLDIDWSRFAVTKEYLDKKTKSEIIRFILKDSGLLSDEEFNRKLESQGLLVPEKLAMLKKPSLVDLVLNAGVDLHGRLPQEIQDIPVLEPLIIPGEKEGDNEAILAESTTVIERSHEE